MTKLQQTVYQLLREIHDICVQNEITYTLHPCLVLFLQNGLDIPEDYESRCVYMTTDDLHRFVAACSANLPQNRSIESLYSNPMYPSLYSARYCNTETLCLNVNEGLNYINNGLFINIEAVRSYPRSTIKKKLVTLLELGWKENTYQYTNRFSKKALLAKIVVRCMMLPGRKRLSHWLYKFASRAYQNENSKVYVRWKNKNLALPKEIFDATLLPTDLDDNFYIPAGWESYLRTALGKKYMRFLESAYIPPLSIIENPYISSDSFFNTHSQLEEFFRKRMSLKKEKRRMASLFNYRNFCWAMINMAGDKYKLKSYYEKIRSKILNLKRENKQAQLKILFRSYRKTQEKYAKYKRTFSIDAELDQIYYETLCKNGGKLFAKRMKKLLRRDHQ